MARTRTKQDIAQDLRSLGVEDGDLLFVHTSLRKVGPVEGRAAGVIEALHEAVGQSGTVVMTLGSQQPWDWVNSRPPEQRPQLLSSFEPFDYLTTPADPDVGVLPEVFRCYPGTVVNNHPDGRFAARGRLAFDLLKDSPWDDYYGPGSLLDRFVMAQGKVLRLGANPDTVTLLHYAEYLTDVPGKRRVTRHHKMKDDFGDVVIREVSCLDDDQGIVDDDFDDDYFAMILREFLDSGDARRGTVGNATSELIDGAAIVAFGAKWMETHLVGSRDV